jgi:endonuclease/exonuclease/phosphatase (EEP) superfamily protein YafD
LGIFSRYPLIPVATDHLAAFDFRIQAARVIAPAGEFLLYNVHPRAPVFSEYIQKYKSLARDIERSIQLQLQYIEALLADIERQDRPVVVVGDFNYTPQSTVYARLSSRLVDGHRSAGWGFGHTFPVHGKAMGGLPVPFSFMRLDMLFHSTELVTLHSRVGKRNGDSDHFPVITTVTWRAPSRRAVSTYSEPET